MLENIKYHFLLVPKIVKLSDINPIKGLNIQIDDVIVSNKERPAGDKLRVSLKKKFIESYGKT